MTPVKNEAWILDRFLQCASTWADHIVVADQHSDDNSRAIAKTFDKVHVVDNPFPGYDEAGRQRLLIDEARRIDIGDRQRVMIALDADEILTANWMSHPEWDTLIHSPPGTVLGFRWVNVGPDVAGGWLDNESKPFGYVDDGAAHEGELIHSPRVPVPPDAPWQHAESIHVLHYQYANWERMLSKQRWYQCWERVNKPDKRPVTIYRQYNFMHADIQNMKPLADDWLDGYEQRGIDMRTIENDAPYHWDESVVEMLHDHGPDTFRKIDIWDVDWRETSRELGMPSNGDLSDPRGPFERQIHRWLSQTQSNMHSTTVRSVQALLRLAGW